MSLTSYRAAPPRATMMRPLRATAFENTNASDDMCRAEAACALAGLDVMNGFNCYPCTHQLQCLATTYSSIA